MTHHDSTTDGCTVTENRLQAEAVAALPPEFKSQWEEIASEVRFRDCGAQPTRLRFFGDNDDILLRVARNVALTVGEETVQPSALYSRVDLAPLARALERETLEDDANGRDQIRDEKLRAFEQRIESVLRASSESPTVLVVEHIGSVPPEIQSLVLTLLEEQEPYIRQDGQKITGDGDDLVVVFTQTPAGSALSPATKRRAGSRWDFCRTGGDANVDD